MPPLYNVDEIAAFLTRFAMKFPDDLRVLAISVKREMLQKQLQHKKFFGFYLE